jgi:HD-GYP domain-containing protein (c-di-GMP phosphodiesterase class II)
MQKHPLHTETILRKIKIFARLARIAGNHHERPDGTGYPHGIGSEDILLETRIITTVDIFDALTAARPYRGPLSVPDALALMERGVSSAIDDRCFRTLNSSLPELRAEIEKEVQARDVAHH